MKLLPEFIPEWKKCLTLRTISSAALAAVGAIQITWATLPEEWKAQVPSDWVVGLTVTVAILGFFGRVVDQGIAHAKSD